LHRRAQIITAALFGDDVGINTAGRNVVGLRERLLDKALIMAEVEIGLRTVIRDIDFAVLER
jgi:hypothetical protein